MRTTSGGPYLSLTAALILVLPRCLSPAAIERRRGGASNPDSLRLTLPLSPPPGCPVAGWAGHGPVPRVSLGANNPLEPKWRTCRHRRRPIPHAGESPTSLLVRRPAGDRRRPRRGGAHRRRHDRTRRHRPAVA